MVQTKIVLHVYIDPMTVITHLFFAKSVNNIAGKTEDHKPDLLEMNKLMNRSQTQSEPAPLVLTPPNIETRRASNSWLIKEEPPDFKARNREGVKQATQQVKSPESKKKSDPIFFAKWRAT